MIIGLSGLSVGMSLIAIMPPTVEPSGVGAGIGAAIALYGLAVTIAGVGLILRRARGAWWLAVVLILAGLAVLVGLTVALGGLDAMFTFGFVVWGLTLACLAAPATRAAVGFGRGSPG